MWNEKPHIPPFLFERLWLWHFYPEIPLQNNLYLQKKTRNNSPKFQLDSISHPRTQPTEARILAKTFSTSPELSSGENRPTG